MLKLSLKRSEMRVECWINCYRSLRRAEFISLFANFDSEERRKRKVEVNIKFF